ncbi:MAG: amino acid adenylation domain-containing protein [Bacteroidota bacterium]
MEAYQSTTEDGVESQKEGAATFCLSAKSAQSLQAYVSAFKDQLAHQSDGLPALAASLHCHREVFPHRFILTANDRSELQEKLQEFSDRPVPTPLSSDSVFLLFDDAGEMGAKELQQLAQHFPALQIDPKEAISGPRISLLLQYQAYQLLTQSATAYLDMIGLGSGRLLIKVLKKELTLQEALAQVDDLPRDATDLAGMKSRAAKLIDRYDKPIHFISLGFKGTMGTAFEQMASQERCGWNIFGGYGQDSLDKSLQTLFLLDREIDPAVLYKHQSIQKLTLPSYEFDRVRCWLRKEGDVFSFGMEEGAAPVAAIDDAGKDLPVQDNILRLFEDVLKMEVKLDDDFFDIGGHSLNGQRLLNRINETYATEFDIDALYDYGTPLAMSDYIRSFQREKEGDSLSDVQPSTEPIKATAQSQLDIPATPQSDGYLLSGAQYRMWILSQFEEGSLAYNLPNVMELKGAFDKDKLQQAISLVVERHEALRTVFRMDEEGEVRQFILSPDEMTVTLDHRDFRSKNDPDAAVEAYAAMDNQQVFNLEDGPLFRVALLQLRDDHTVFYFNLHHIIADGWSLGILTRDVMAQYESLLSGRAVALPALDIQYKDYAHWQAGLLKDGHSKSHRDFWMEKLGGELPQLNLPSQKKRPPVRTYNAQKLETYLSTVQSQQLYAFSKEQRGSLFITLLALWNVLLHRYTNQNDIIIGSPIAGRDHASLENQIGCYINSLALRNEIQEEETFLSFYQTIRKETLATYAHQMYPFDQLVEDLGGARDLSRNPVFDVMLVLQNTGERISEDHLSASDKAAMTEEVRASEPTFSRFDLEIAFTEVGDQLLLVIHYNTDVYEKAMVEGLIAHFRSLTHQLLSQPGQAVGKVDFLSKAEKEQQLETFNQPSLLPDGVPATVVGAFQKCVAQNPDAIALLTMDRSYTYGEMHRLSNQLADFLQRHEKVTKGDLVALQLPRNEWMVIGLLAILKSGSGYIPFDMDYSPARLQQVAEDSQYQCHLGVELLETFQQTQDQYSEEDISMELQADDLAHVIYTSGSTGKPKGVLIPHRGVVRMSRLKNLPLHAKTRLLQLSSISFDAATFEIWCLILNGGSLVLYPEAKADLETINETVRQKGINTLFLTTALFNQWVHSDISDLPLEYVLTGGEVANPSSAVRLYESHASVKLINCYGPSENTSFTTCFEVPRHWSAEDNIPIGQPIAGTEVYILSAAAQLCPIGVTGELCTSGLGLALGYLNREDLSAEKFIDHPFHSGQKLYRTGDMAHWLPNGHIGFVGRDDGQVKIRGFRIELGEVEHQLRQLDALQSVVLRIWEDASGEKDMVAYFVSDQAQDASQMREFLLERLPAYMIPAYFVQLDAMPLNLNGKVDRSKLPSPEETALAGSNTYVAPQNDVEATLVRLWSEVLRQKQIGTQDPFFVIGGNSIKAIKVLSKIKQTFELSVKIDKFFEYDTIEAMAAHINFVLKQQELSKNRSQLKELEL